MRLNFLVRFAKIPRATFPWFALGFARRALWFPGLPITTLRFAGTIIQLAQRAAQRFDLSFVGQFLAFGQLDQFQNFFHLIHRVLQRLDDFHHLVNRLMDGGGAMFRFGTTHPIGQTLDAFEQRPGRFGSAARRQGFWCDRLFWRGRGR